MEVGKTMTGIPACPYAINSISRCRWGLYHL